MRSTVIVRSAKTGYVVMSAVFILFGTLFIALPGLTIQIAGKMLGTALLLFGCIRLAGYFSKALPRLIFKYDLEFGIIAVITGFIVLLKPSDAISLLFVITGTAMLADSLLKLRVATKAGRPGFGHLNGTIVPAVIAGIIAVALVFRPSESSRLITVLLGIMLVAEGVLNLFAAIAVTRNLKHRDSDVIECDFFEEDEYR